MGTDVKFPAMKKPILTTNTTAFVLKCKRQAGSAELAYRGLILSPVSRTSDCLEMFGLSTEFPTTDLGSWAWGPASFQN